MCCRRFHDDEGRAGPRHPVPAAAGPRLLRRLPEVCAGVPGAGAHRHGILPLHVDQHRGERHGLGVSQF